MSSEEVQNKYSHLATEKALELRLTPDQLLFLRRVRKMVSSCQINEFNDAENLTCLQELADYVGLDLNKTSIHRICQYVERLHGFEGLPAEALSSVVAVMGKKFVEIMTSEEFDFKSSPFWFILSQHNYKLPGIFPGEDVFWSDALRHEFMETAISYYSNVDELGNFMPDLFFFEQMKYCKTSTDFRWIMERIDKLVSLNFTGYDDFIGLATERLDPSPQLRVLFSLKSNSAAGMSRNTNPAFIRRRLKDIPHRNDNEFADDGDEDDWSLIRLICMSYDDLIRELMVIGSGNQSPFGTFGNITATKLLSILALSSSEEEVSINTAADHVLISQKRDITRLERHWESLELSWGQVSSLPMNPPVLEHRGKVLADYGRLRPDFVDRMFRQIDTEFGSAYTDEQRAEYTRMMCEGIEGGMSLTGTGRVEYPFWKSVFTRMNGDGVQDIIHVDSGASLGLVDLEIWSDERTGSGALAGKVRRVLAVDRILEKKLLDRVYRFNEKQYDQTLELLSVEEASSEYEKAKGSFTNLHPKAEFEHLTADTTANFTDLPAELRELEGKVTLFTDMRANFLHGKPEDREKVFRNAEVLLAEGGRAYFQRGLPIYGDLVLGAVYKKINGRMEAEALQLNKQGESVTVWRLNESGSLVADWEEQLKQVLET